MTQLQPAAIATASSAPKVTTASRRWPWIVAAIVVIGAAIAMRFRAHFADVVPPGIDAAYYPVQARWLLQEGRLMLRDLPLKFALDAGAARLLMVGGLDIDRAVMMASQWLDILLPPLAAVPIVLLVRRWSRGRSSAVLAAVGAGLMAVVQLAALRMTAEFEKNALGLVWFCFLAHALVRAFDRGTIVRWLAVGAWLTLAGLTHVGVAGASLAMVATSILSWAVWSRRLGWKQFALGFGALAVSGGLVLGAMAIVDPGRARELLAAPAKMLGAGADGERGGFGPPPMGAMRGEGPGDGLEMGPRGGMRGMPPFSPGGPGGPGGRGGPDGGFMRGARWDFLWPTLTSSVVLLATLIFLVVRRKRTNAADAAVVIGAATTGLILTAPLMGAETHMRLLLMAPTPAAICLCWVLGAGQRFRIVWAVAGVLTAGVSVGSLALHGQGPSMSHLREAELAELKSLAEYVPAGRRTLVMARHGMEFWAAYYLHTPARSGEIPADAFDRYDRVFVLTEARPLGGMGPPGGMPPNMRPRGPDEAADGLDDLPPPPLDEFGEPGEGFEPADMGRGPDDFERRGPPPGFNGRPGGPGGGGPGGMMGVRIPAGAKLITRGKTFRLHEAFRPKDPDAP